MNIEPWLVDEALKLSNGIYTLYVFFALAINCVIL